MIRRAFKISLCKILYTLYTALEPCPMCMVTMVMGGIRNIIIRAHDGRFFRL
ncbi:MAG: hypothetical protein K2K46_12695 [Lachnospiraceae bacterium]|nr:hypothetical protein [Lachnospiraceae bacterium]